MKVSIYVPCTACALLLLVLAVFPASAQRAADTLYVTAALKTEAHPYYGIGSDRGYLINGVEGATVTIVRDSLYLFNVTNLPPDLGLAFYSVPIGGTSGIYQEHLESYNAITDNWVVKASSQTPDTLYYASVDEPWVGGTILVVDSLTLNIRDEGPQAMESREGNLSVFPNPSSGQTTIRFALDESSQVRIVLSDAVGRTVFEIDRGRLAAGSHAAVVDLTDEPSGLYYVHVVGAAFRGKSINGAVVHLVK